MNEVERLLSQPDPSTPTGLRDRAMLELLYATGLRVSELIHVKVFDINMEAGFLRTLGKGSKERLVPVGEKALNAAKEYLLHGRRPLVKGLNPPFLFLNGRGRAVDAAGLLENHPGLWSEGLHCDGKSAPTVCDIPSPPTFWKVAPT